jgi:1-acyl-sn-glycerol-3-phosphate acyltransferase
MIRWFYFFSKGLCWIVFRLLWRFQVAGGLENVPATGPVIVACNHVSYLDPVALGIALQRPLTYLAKKQLFAIPVLGPVITALGTYPVDREAGGLTALRAAVRVLKEGNCVGIFPEGTRNLTGDAEEKGGAALLAALSGAPVVPAAIGGTRDAKRLAQIRVIYGEPIVVKAERRGTEALEPWTAEIMRRIRDLEAQLAAGRKA